MPSIPNRSNSSMPRHVWTARARSSLLVALICSVFFKLKTGHPLCVWEPNISHVNISPCPAVILLSAQNTVLSIKCNSLMQDGVLTGVCKTVDRVQQSLIFHHSVSVICLFYFSATTHKRRVQAGLAWLPSWISFLSSPAGFAEELKDTVDTDLPNCTALSPNAASPSPMMMSSQYISHHTFFSFKARKQ